jgi:hypothetical protein
VREGTIGVGALDPGTLILIAVVAAIAVSGIVYYMTTSEKTQQVSRIMDDICVDAMRTGNQRAYELCKDFANKSKPGVIEEFLGPSASKYLALALFGSAAFLVAPHVIDKLARDKRHRDLVEELIPAKTS